MEKIDVSARGHLWMSVISVLENWRSVGGNECANRMGKDGIGFLNFEAYKLVFSVLMQKGEFFLNFDWTKL